MFAKGSRYEDVPDAVHTDRAGREIAYKRLRFIPYGGVALQTHTVALGERLDIIAHRYYRDAEQFWRIADGNAAFDPDELTAEVGRRLLIPQQGR